MSFFRISLDIVVGWRPWGREESRGRGNREKTMMEKRREEVEESNKKIYSINSNATFDKKQ